MSEANSMPVTIEKTRLNLWNIVSIFIGIAVTAFGWGVTYAAMQSANAEAVKSIANVQSEIKDIRQQLPAITQLQFQATRATEGIAENRKSIEETNARLDRALESFGGRLDTIIERLNQVATNVEVLRTRVERSDATPQRTDFRR